MLDNIGKLLADEYGSRITNNDDLKEAAKEAGPLRKK